MNRVVDRYAGRRLAFLRSEGGYAKGGCSGKGVSADSAGTPNGAPRSRDAGTVLHRGGALGNSNLGSAYLEADYRQGGLGGGLPANCANEASRVPDRLGLG